MAAPAKTRVIGDSRPLAMQQDEPTGKAGTSKPHERDRLSQIALVRI